MAISKEQWKAIEAELKRSWVHMLFELNGHKISVNRERKSESTTVLTVYIDGSIHGIWCQDLNDSIESQVQRNSVRVGSALAYAGVHQDGFSGSVQVPAHIRRITQAFGKALKSPTTASVGGFTRQMEMPARPYLGLSSDNQTELLAVIGGFWQDVMKEAGL